MATALRCHALLHLAPVGTAPKLRGRHLAWQANLDDHSKSIHIQLQKNSTSWCPLTTCTATSLGNLSKQYLWGNKIMVTTHLFFPSLGSISHICTKLLGSGMLATSNRSAMLLHISRVPASLFWAWKGRWMAVAMVRGWHQLWAENRW